MVQKRKNKEKIKSLAFLSPLVTAEDNLPEKWHLFLCNRCPSHNPINSIKPLKETQYMISTTENYPLVSGLTLSASTTGLMKQALLPLCDLVLSH